MTNKTLPFTRIDLLLAWMEELDRSGWPGEIPYMSRQIWGCYSVADHLERRAFVSR
jgi:hypothetical protein